MQETRNGCQNQPFLKHERPPPTMDQAELERVRDWATAKIVHGSEPPWAWYQYMKLRESLEAILVRRARLCRVRRAQGQRSHVRKGVSD
jgi:hypothetical protein